MIRLITSLTLFLFSLFSSLLFASEVPAKTPISGKVLSEKFEVMANAIVSLLHSSS